MNASMKVGDSISLAGISYSIEPTYEFPSSLQQDLSFDRQLPSSGIEVQEGFYLHIAVDAKMTKKGSHPQQIYLALKQKGEQSLETNVYGHENLDSNKYHITLDI